MKKIFLSICLLFSVVMAAAAERDYSSYTKTTLAEYYAFPYSYLRPNQIIFDAYIQAIEYSPQPVDIIKRPGSPMFISFYDDSGHRIGIYHNMTTNSLKLVEKWKKRKKRVTVYAHEESTRENKAYGLVLWLDWIQEK